MDEGGGGGSFARLLEAINKSGGATAKDLELYLLTKLDGSVDKLEARLERLAERMGTLDTNVTEKLGTLNTKIELVRDRVARKAAAWSSLAAAGMYVVGELIVHFLKAKGGAP